MNRDEITRKTSELSTIAHTTEDSKVEYWYARELMTYMGSCALSRTKFPTTRPYAGTLMLIDYSTLSVYPNHTQ